MFPHGCMLKENRLRQKTSITFSSDLGEATRFSNLN